VESMHDTPERFLDPLAVDVLFADCYSWECAQKVDQGRGKLLLYVRHFLSP